MFNTKKIHPAWNMMIVFMFIHAGTAGIIVNCTGILFSAIREEMNFGAGELSVYYLIRTLSSAAAVGVTSHLFFKYNSKIVMSVLGIIYTCSVGSMFFFDHLWQWYIAAVLNGIGMSCNMVVIPVVLSNWFKSKRGFVIGLTMSASGVAGAVFSPICSQLIHFYGWRVTSLIMAAIGFCFIVLPSCKFLVSSPEELGKSPYMAGDDMDDSASFPSSQSRSVEPHIFVCALLSLISVTSLIQFSQQIPTFAQTAGYSISIGATMVSLSMIGNLLGKFGIGMLIDRLGVYRAVHFFLMGIACSMIGYLVGSHLLFVMYLSSIAYGMVYAIGTTVPSLLFSDIYGTYYKTPLSRMQGISGLISAFISIMFPYMYDFTGTFHTVFVFGIGGCMLSYLLFFYMQNYVKNQNKKVDDHVL